MANLGQVELDFGIKGFDAISKSMTWLEGIGKKIADKKVSFAELEEWVLDKKVMHPASGRQEYLEALINKFI